METSTTPALTCTMTNNKILVLGATGKTGRRVAARLRLAGYDVRSASRSSPTPFDWSDPSGWNAALSGVSAIYIVPPTTPGPMAEFVARAEIAGVKRLVLLSGRGADLWGDSGFGLDMLSAEDAVRHSNLEWTVLRASNFDQDFDEDVFYAPLVAGELALPAGTVPEPFIDVEDVAEVAAVVLSQPAKHASRVYELTGPRPVTFAEATEMISRASGRPIAYRQLASPHYKAELVAQGVDEEAADHITEMFVMMERGIISQTTGDVARVIGREPHPFEDYVARLAAKGTWLQPDTE
jgi:uncharacterized protein YbjT (DUF2867 family)